MKDKNVAGILALFLGGFGVHRFYLGQNGLGVFYLLFFWFPIIWFVGLIDAIVFFSMDKENFDRKYNKAQFSEERYLDTDFVRRDRHRRERTENRQAKREQRQERSYDARRQQNRPSPPRRGNPYKASGIKRYKDYDYDGAIEDFLKALDLEPNDVATHFNLACAYSLNEKPDKAFYHLDRAVANGFNDFQKIKSHDAFAFLRIQEQFDVFEKSGFRLSPGFGTRPSANAQQAKDELPEEDVMEGHPDLLEQLQRLGELRERGLLTEEEFALQKKKLFS